MYLSCITLVEGEGEREACGLYPGGTFSLILMLSRLGRYLIALKCRIRIVLRRVNGHSSENERPDRIPSPLNEQLLQ